MPMLTKITMVGHFSGISFGNFSTANSSKFYSPGPIVFGHDTILPIKHKVDCKVLCQQNWTKINKYNIHKNSRRLCHYYKVGYKIMLVNTTAYKYETPYNRPFVITQC